MYIDIYVHKIVFYLLKENVWHSGYYIDIHLYLISGAFPIPSSYLKKTMKVMVELRLSTTMVRGGKYRKRNATVLL